jgi:LysM repeat protein
MTDDANDKQPKPQRRRRAPDETASPSGGRAQNAAPPDDDPMAALERLQSLTSAAAPSVADSPPMAPKTRRSPPVAARPAAAPRAGRMVARIAAPVVFLVAVVALLSIVSQSGIIGGKAEPLITPTPKASKTKSTGNATQHSYRIYVVKSGDTLSGIAVKFGVSTSDLETLNPKISSSTLVVGAKVKVPKSTP